jgi:hypothetical protein
MPSRNEPCPCGSTAKYKRCCLPRADAVAAELRSRDALLARLIDWVRDEHLQVLEDAERETAVVRMLRGRTGRSMSLIWALNDVRPRDGGPPLMSRFAALSDLDPVERDIAIGLADARLDVYRVCAGTSATVQLESLAGGARVEILAEDGLQELDVGDIVVARVVGTTLQPTLWGLVARFDCTGMRRWLALLADLPTDRERASLILLSFHPDDAAEPLPDGIDLLTRTWPIDDDDAVLEALEDDDSFECIGEAIPSGWAFSWIEEGTCGCLDLGGWTEDDDIEVARLVVREREMIVVSGDRDTLRKVTAHVQRYVWELIAAPRLGRAA